MSLLERTRAALDQAITVYRGTGHDGRLMAQRDRLGEPLRVAIAGRVKAGKSTLLNALVGERLAPTDARECTKVVTWYRNGHTYRVLARPRGGGPPRQLPFSRGTAAIEIDFGGLAVDDLAELEVTWPSQALRTATLIDAPGIGSLSTDISRRTWELLAPDDEETPADAVLYLMRHLHAGDLDFLRAFHDVDVARPNPVNAIGVLSRADEIGVGRIDAMASARRVAARLAAEPNVRRVAQTVVPVAGLLAETAATLTETETDALRRVAALPPQATEQLLLTADRFVNTAVGLDLTTEQRAALLHRFGLFGVRLSCALLRRGAISTAVELARELTERSGINQLRQTLDTLFFERRDVLKSRSALLALDTLTRQVPRPGSAAVAATVEEVIASAHPFNELRVLSSVRAGWVDARAEVLVDLERLIGGGGTTAAQRLDLPTDAAPTALAKAAEAALLRWQRRAENPLTRHELAVASRVAIRSCEGLLADLAGAR